MDASTTARPESKAGRRHQVRLAEPFRFEAGGELAGARLAVETWGELAPGRDNAVLIFTGMSASAHAAATDDDPDEGWWEDLIGPGRALDTRQLFVIVANSIGSCFGSSGPGDVDPATGSAFGARWPELRVEDIARGGQLAVEHFGIGELSAVIGVSLGGMVVLAHAALYPGRARRLVCISGAMAPSAFAIATRALQRELLARALVDDALDVSLAFRLARKVGMLSYVGAALLENRFAQTLAAGPPGPSGTHYQVESWLEHQARKFEARFNAWSYWTLSRAMDLFDFARLRRAPGTGYGLKLERAMVIGVHEDQLFPLRQQADIAEMLRGEGVPTEFVELNSAYGHDAFLVEDAMFTPLLREFLR